ncbi:putative sugar O-methyltransferase [Candidatus Pelagibacter sp.]|uniref:putative sugar O-methyltransferase n=1 Tax=Candidatus Pelagibacter sp. TaxID=2024849 RepID=UPI003F83A828
MLLDLLIKDEKKIDKELYSSGPYWNYKNSRAIIEIKKKGLEDFRGITSGIGTSFADNLVLDVRNEFNIKGRIVGKIFSLPFLNTIFSEQMKTTKVYLDSFVKNQAILYQNSQNVRNLISKFKFNNTTDFGCIQSFKYLNKNYSCHYLNMAYRINNLSKYFDFKNIKVYFEIGGGFGSNIHFLITNFPNIKKILYLDIVPNIYVGTEYLRYYYKEKVKDYLELKNLDKISFSKNNELEIFCVPPWLIEKIDTEIDHFHNAASFVEMPKKVISNYVKFIKKLNTKEISLISYSGFDLKTTFNPEELNSFFNDKLSVSWKNSLIEEYNRKEIYLTSN